jgi:acylphosphatase
MKGFHAVIHGRVQGVAFRWFALEEARRLGVTGNIRNNDDGTVEVVAEGEGKAVDAFEKWLRHGPSYARVDRFEKDELTVTGKYRNFEVY